MPCFRATIVRSNPAIPNSAFHFIAGSDRQAVARMPMVLGDATLELWRGERLVAMIDARAVTVAEYNVALVAAAFIEMARITGRPAAPGRID